MRKTLISLLALSFIVSLSAAPLAKAEEQASADANFGTCTVDPISEESFIAEAITSVRVRDVACMEASTVLTSIPKGGKVQVTAKTDGWYKIKTTDNIVGWVGATLLKKSDSTSALETFVALKEKAVTAASSLGEKAKALANRLKGRILLAVENNGEAYYVADDGSRIYLKDGNAAYQAMRDLGLGVSEDNYNKVKNNSDKALKEKLKGKIILRVENKGEAYYINPEDSQVHYLKDGNAAYQVMRAEGLGVSNANLNQLPEKTLAEYKQELSDLKEKLKALQQEAEALRAELKRIKEGNSAASDNGTVTVSSLSLKAAVSGQTAKLTWGGGNGLDLSKGYKLVIGTEESPVYPGNDYHYLSSADTRSDVWENLEPGTYYFRVCQYLGEKCGAYSNNAKVVIPAKAADTANSDGFIKLQAKTEGNKAILSWYQERVNVDKGFKVVISNKENPVYPGNDYHYLSDPDTKSDNWENLKPGTYYFRVCQYLGGKCGVYSNNIKVVIVSAPSATTEGSDESTSTPTSANGSISLSASIQDSKVALKWVVNDVNVDMGFKVVIGDQESPVYPGNDYHYLDNASVRSDTWELSKSGTYYFRVCQYLGGKCGVYSNNVKVIAEEAK